MQLEVYTAVKTQLETIAALKYVKRWNNQFERMDTNVSFDFPCAFIEFANIDYEDLTGGVQRYEMDIIIHVGSKSFATDDTAIFTLKQTINAKLHMFSSATSAFETRLLRRNETPSVDHGDFEDYPIIYHASGTDFAVNTLPDTDATVTILADTVAPIITNTIIRTASPTIP